MLCGRLRACCAAVCLSETNAVNSFEDSTSLVRQRINYNDSKSIRSNLSSMFALDDWKRVEKNKFDSLFPSILPMFIDSSVSGLFVAI